MKNKEKFRITINIEKKYAFMLFGAFFLLVFSGIVFANSLERHYIADLVHGTIPGDLNTSGRETIAKGDIILKGLPDTAPHNKLSEILCDIKEEYCE